VGWSHPRSLSPELRPQRSLSSLASARSSELQSVSAGRNRRRRFWPIKVGCIDIEDLIRNRDQLFAEAVHLDRQGFRWWPDAAFEREVIAPEQEARYELDASEERIREFLVAKQRTTILVVAQIGLRIELPKIETADQRRIVASLERSGCARGKRGNTARWWMPAVEATE
jgi:predicted P-loop ATPase